MDSTIARMREAALVAVCVLGWTLACAREGDVTVESRFVAFGFDDGRASDFAWVAPLFSKHGVHATFNIINGPHATTPDYVRKVNRLIELGHEIGDHTILHRTYMYVHPFFNGQAEQGYVGGEANRGFPSNDEMRRDHGEGRNVFGVPLSQRLKDSRMYYFGRIGLSDPETKTWGALTDADCQALRSYYSVWGDEGLDYLDKLSARYCGTTGSSKDPASWNGQEFTKGIFAGCKTTATHEIWDRMVEIQQRWYTDHYGLDAPPTNWSFPGGAHSPDLLYPRGGKRYFDRECTILANHYGKCLSTRTGKSRSWADLLRASGIKTVSDSSYEGRMDGAIRRSILVQLPLNAHLSRDDSVCRLAYFDKVSFAPRREYDPKAEPLASSSNWLRTMYEADPTFKRGIDTLVRQSSRGRIAFGLNDSLDTFTWRLFFDLFLQFCRKADIEAVSMKEAYEIAFKTPVMKGNLFRNAAMRRTVLEVIGAKNSPTQPDGWTAGKVETTKALGARPINALVLEGATRSELFLFGVPLGKLELTFAALKGSGPSKLTVRKIRNIDRYLDAKACPVIGEIAIDDGTAWKRYGTTLLLEDVPRLSAPSTASPTCDGLDNKVCGLVFELEGQGAKFALPSLTKP